MKKVNEAHVGYCRTCNHQALIVDCNDGQCVACATWDAASVQRHHDLNGLHSLSNRMLPVKEGAVCPFCKD